MSRRIPLLLAVLLGATEARAVTWRPRPPEPSGPDLPKRYALDATASGVAFPGSGASLAAGGRLRVRDDPFQFELSVDRDLTDRAEPDLRWLVLGGGGLARALSPRWDLFGSFVLGAYGMRVQDGWGTRWLTKYSPAVGIRVGVSRRFFTGARLLVEPTAGLYATLLAASPRHDTTRDLNWGGPSALVTLAVGAQTVTRDAEADGAE